MPFGQATYIPYKKKSYKPSSTKQNRARERNWYIRKLRAYFHLCPIFEGRGKQIQALIDEELISIGAESEIERTKKRIEGWEKDMQERSAGATQVFDFPEYK